MDSSFLTPKISAKFYRGNTYGDAKCRWGGSKSTFATTSRRYTGDIHNSTVVGLFMTPIGQ